MCKKPTAHDIEALAFVTWLVLPHLSKEEITTRLQRAVADDERDGQFRDPNSNYVELNANEAMRELATLNKERHLSQRNARFI